MIKMSEIAELANVSVATVSLALNNKKGVGEKTRKNIISIAKEHGYIIPQKSTKNFSKQLNILFIVAFNNKFLNENFRTQPFFSSLTDIIINYSFDDKINFSISSVSSDTLIDEIHKVSDNNYDGIIVLATNLSNISVDGCINNSKKPVVFLDCTHNLAEGNIVGINNEQGVYLAIKHLVDNGHKKIGYVMSDTRINNFEGRFNSFNKYIKKFNLEFNDENVIRLSPNEIDLQDETVSQIKKLKNTPTAFFCENDTLAISFIKSLTKHGFDVPNDISVIGFDNIREATVVTPELTTISIDQNLFVRTAIEQLLFSINNPGVNRHTYINGSLVVRDSVKNIN